MIDQYSKYFKNRGVDNCRSGKMTLDATLKSLMPTDKDARILEIGCGFGNCLSLLMVNGYGNVVGVDISDEAIEKCLEKGLMVSKISDLTELGSYSEKDRYDLILMIHVLEHFQKERIIDTLKYIKKELLKKSGSLYIVVPNAQSNTGSYWAYEDFTHSTIFTAGSLSFVLRTAGFDEVIFLDPKGTGGLPIHKRIFVNIFLKLYALKLDFWNKVTSSHYHRPSPRIYTYEIKALAR